MQSDEVSGCWPLSILWDGQRRRSFADKNTALIFEREKVKRVASKLRRAALRKLALLDAAESLEDLRVPPGNRLEKLAGDRDGQHSIRINDQWRICFRWSERDAHEVEIIDYH
jgi:proteic killer suppression protein